MMYEIKIKNNGNKTSCPHREKASLVFRVEFSFPPLTLCHMAVLKPKTYFFLFFLRFHRNLAGSAKRVNCVTNASLLSSAPRLLRDAQSHQRASFPGFICFVFPTVD